MKDEPPSEDITVPDPLNDMVRRIRVRFDAELKNNLNPQIENCLLSVSDLARKQLFRELVAIDFFFRQRHGGKEFADYFVRFPQFADVLIALKKELDANDETRAADSNTPGVIFNPPRANPANSADGSGTPALRRSNDETLFAENIPQPNLSRFKILKLAGSGGFGNVWQAYDLVLHREVAVKVPRADRALGSGAIREARAAAGLTHPNIVQVFEVGQENGIDFIVTAYVNGVNLKEWLKKNSLDPWQSARLVATVATAIQHAHDKSVIHRDLKLTNILMDEQGKPHIVDFGIAKQEAKDDSLAVQGQAVGSPAYMSPEQAKGDHGSVGRRSDVYALGVILYELLTGTTPFRGDIPELMRQIVNQPPVAPRQIKSGIPKDLERICLKCLAKEMENRYATAQALANDLHRFLNGETLQGIPVAMPDRAWKWCLRHRKAIVRSSLVALAVAIFCAGLMTWYIRNLPPALPPEPLVTMEFTTEVPGCEITVCRINPMTFEEDLSTLKKAEGKTPVKMDLPTGDYLIVAVLYSDDDGDSRPIIHRFNEVYRHVPSVDEVKPIGYRHLRWKRTPEGVVQVDSIPIPRPDISSSMAFCEPKNFITETGSESEKNKTRQQWNIPPFFVDRHEVTVEDLNHLQSIRQLHLKTYKGPFLQLPYYLVVELLEQNGRRPPSAAEMSYLATLPCDDCDKCQLPDKSVIEGLHSGPWEWTSSKPSSPFSGAKSTTKQAEEHLRLPRLIGGGAIDGDPALLKTSGLRIAEEHSQEIGIRGVRSAKPRLRPKDFVQLKDSTKYNRTGK